MLNWFDCIVLTMFTVYFRPKVTIQRYSSMLNWFDLYSSDNVYCLFQTQGSNTEVLIYAQLV